MAETKHTLVALVEDKPGVLNRMVSLFRRRGFNIESIAVGASEIPKLSRMTIVVNGSAPIVEQVRKQSDKIVSVLKVSDITDDDIVVRELALIKVKATTATRSEIIQLVDIFRASIVDVARSLVIEVTGMRKRSILCNLLRGFGIRSWAGRGGWAMTRGGFGNRLGARLAPERLTAHPRTHRCYKSYGRKRAISGFLKCPGSKGDMK
jgi:acetolactate synthase-1/3 small subunit